MYIIFNEENRYGDGNGEIVHNHCVEEYFLPSIKLSMELFSVHTRKVKRTWNYPPHEHPMYEINLVTEGHQIFTVNGKQYDQREGDFMLIRPGDIHSSCGGEEDFTYFCMHFSIDDKVFLPYLKGTNEIYFSANRQMSRRVRPLLERMIDLTKNSYDTRSIIDQIQVQTTILELFGALVSGFEEEKDCHQQVPEAVSQLAFEIAERVDKLVNKPSSIAEDESLKSIEDIAGHLGISVSHCNKVFKRIYHMSPRQYLSFKMLNEAKTLLLQKRLSVEQISEVLGYHDIAHFSRQFKRWTGMAPSEYRGVLGKQ